jgi:putative ABC transport system permease protein
MWIFSFAWKNLWRNKGRTMITISAVAFATLISMIAASLKEGIFGNLIHNIVSSYTGHIQVHRNGYQDEQILENGFIPEEKIKKKIEGLSNLGMITARLESFALVSSGETTKGCIIMGIEDTEIKNFSAIGNKLVKGRIYQNTNELVLSEGLAKKLGKTNKDTVIIIGQGYRGTSAAGKYIISGIIHLASPKLNDRMIVMSLATAQQLFAAENIATSWSILLKGNADVEQTTTQIRSLSGTAFETLSWGDILPDIKQHINTDSENMQFVQLILYILVSFGIFSTLLIMMSERRKENGMLLALGMSKFRLQMVLAAESLMTVMIGSLTGLLLSSPIVFYFKSHPLKIAGKVAEAYQRFGFEPIFPTSTDSSIFLKQSLIVFIIGIVLSLYPIGIILKMNALRAMKK